MARLMTLSHARTLMPPSKFSPRCRVRPKRQAEAQYESYEGTVGETKGLCAIDSVSIDEKNVAAEVAPDGGRKGC